MSRNIFIIAGEASGDQHGALLIRAMKKLDPGLKFIGIGGNRMAKEGLKTLFHIDRMAVMGFVEVIRHLKFFRHVQKAVLETFEKVPFDRVILIDYPGFNLRIAQKIHQKFGIPITYYISPQLWAWKPGRAKIIREHIRQLLVIFPFEPDWYSKRGIKAVFTGHPMLDEWQPSSRGDLCRDLNLDPLRPILTLYPGSRKQEIRKHFPLLVQAAKQLMKEVPGLQVITGAAPGFTEIVDDIPLPIQTETRHPRKTLEVADAAIVASGTSTLEAAFFNTPMVIVYKLNLFSWWITRLFVKIDFAGMVNIIAGKMIVPELLQSQATPENITRHALRYFTDTKHTERTRSELTKVREAFGEPGATHRAAEAILKDMELLNHEK